MGSIADLATVALVGGIGYLVLTRTNILGGSSNQLDVTPAKNIKDETTIKYDSGVIKKETTVRDNDGNEYRAETLPGDGWATDAVDIAADAYRTVEPYNAAVIDAAARGDEKARQDAENKAMLHLGGADNPIAAFSQGVADFFISLF